MYGQPAYGQPGYGHPPAYGGHPPGYGQPPPGYGHPQGPTVIHVDNDDNDGTPCQYCGTNTTHICRRTSGGVTYAWCCCLLITTGFLCFVPFFCCENCKDVELVCIKCQQVKNKIPANCC